jgi:hypothetical protein
MLDRNALIPQPVADRGVQLILRRSCVTGAMEPMRND